jgi:membrane protein
MRSVLAGSREFAGLFNRNSMRLALRRIGQFAGLFTEAGRNFSKNNMSSMAAALAYNALLSLAPLLFVIVAVFRLLAGEQAVEEQILEQVGGSLGPKAVPAVRLLLSNMSARRPETFAVGGGTLLLLLIFATGVFQQLIQALNVVWKAHEEGRQGILGSVQRRIRSHFFALIILACIGLYLYVSMALSAVRAIQGQQLVQAIPALQRILPGLPHFIGAVALFPLFMLVFRVLPARRIAWKDVWCGALVTAVLFWLINRLILYYLQHTGATSFYGAVGSFVIVLLWVYWASMILLYGAEFAKAWAGKYGTLRRN